jgi:hypothetical protein
MCRLPHESAYLILTVKFGEFQVFPSYFMQKYAKTMQELMGKVFFLIRIG